MHGPRHLPFGISHPRLLSYLDWIMLVRLISSQWYVKGRLTFNGNAIRKVMKRNWAVTRLTALLSARYRAIASIPTSCLGSLMWQQWYICEYHRQMVASWKKALTLGVPTMTTALLTEYGCETMAENSICKRFRKNSIESIVFSHLENQRFPLWS